MARTVHGGNIHELSKKLGVGMEHLINFAGNINPLGISERLREVILSGAELVREYPDPSFLELRRSIEDYTGVHHDNVLVGNGATALIRSFIRSISYQSAVIISPAYSEYERELKLLEKKYTLYPLLEERDFKLDVSSLLSTIGDNTLIILCNPNNPTGSFVTKAEIERILDYGKSRGISLLLDETYVEFCFDVSNVSGCGLINSYSNLYVIRGTSKFFGCPGLRLGYGLTSNQKITNASLEAEEPWALNVFAEAGGRAMFRDWDFIRKSREHIKREREIMLRELSSFNSLKPFSTNSNFVLIKILQGLNATQLREGLLDKGMIIRDCGSFPYLGSNYFRVCFMDRDSNRILIEILKRYYD